MVKEVHIREDADKIDDTDITMDENGHYRIFDKLSSAVENGDDGGNIEPSGIGEDILSAEFLQRTKVSQIKILLAEIKKQINSTEEASIKVEYVKKLYAEQLKKLHDS